MTDATTTDRAAIRIDEILATARARNASDVHLGGEDRPALRIAGDLIVLDEDPLPQIALQHFLDRTLEASSLAQLRECGAGDGARRLGTAGPCRIHAFRTAGGLRVAIRLLAQTIPHLESLGLPPVIASFARQPMGLVLFTGPTGSGKSTALAALVDHVNRGSERHIITIEDPIEYTHVRIRSLVTQCEIGRDVASYAEAVRAFLRADPDIILIGEMRDRETMAAALTAAETGHLVFSTLHTNDAPQTIDRIVDAFPSERQSQIRAQLAAVLVGVVSMRLVTRRTGNGRRAAAEVLIATDGVRNLIREGKTHQLRNAIATGRDAGMQTLEADLSALVRRGDIAGDVARAASVRPHDIRDTDTIFN